MRHSPRRLLDQEKLDLLQKHRMPGLKFDNNYDTKKTNKV